MMHLENTKDTEIWDAFRAGNEPAFIFIREKYVRPLYRYAFRLCQNPDLAREATADLLTDLWIKRERLGATNNIGNYLYMSLRRRVVDEITIRKRYVSSEDSDFEILGGEQAHPEKIITDSEEQEGLENMINRALGTISERQREAIHLKFYAGKDYKEISEIMGLSSQSTYNLIHRALKAMRDVIKVVSILIMLSV
ncbi:MAG: sigma-70 family RNA polymerase sigma factor [Bacteroidota bacterium]